MRTSRQVELESVKVSKVNMNKNKNFHTIKDKDFWSKSWITSRSKLLWIEIQLKDPLEITSGDKISIKIDKKFVEDILNIGFSEKLIGQRAESKLSYIRDIKDLECIDVDGDWAIIPDASGSGVSIAGVLTRNIREYRWCPGCGETECRGRRACSPHWPKRGERVKTRPDGL